jgi:hypothetical protein
VNASASCQAATRLLRVPSVGLGADSNCALLAKVAVLVFIGALQSSCTGKPTAPIPASTQRPSETGKQSGTAPDIIRRDPLQCPPWNSAEPRPSQVKGGHRVILSWRASAPADTRHAAAIGYCIYRRLEPDDPSPIRVNTVPYPGTSCADDLVQNDKKYSYVVKAISANGVRSESSNWAPAEIPNHEPRNPSGSSVPLCREPVSRKQY